MPRGLGVGAVTTAGRLHLCVHYRHALLDRSAAADFTALYCQTLGELAGEAGMIAHPGIILAVAATVIYNLGFICEKRALDRLPAIEAHRLGHLARTLFTAPAWLAGFLLICCGLMLQVLVLSLEPLTVAQPLQASGVVVTILFSRLMLHERLGRAELTCIGVIAVAVALLSLSNGRGPGAEAGTHAAGAAIAAAAIPACLAVPAIYYLAHRASRRPAPSAPGHRRELRLLRRAGLRVRRGGAQGTVGVDIRRRRTPAAGCSPRPSRRLTSTRCWCPPRSACACSR